MLSRKPTKVLKVIESMPNTEAHKLRCSESVDCKANMYAAPNIMLNSTTAIGNTISNEIKTRETDTGNNKDEDFSWNCLETIVKSEYYSNDYWKETGWACVESMMRRNNKEERFTLTEWNTRLSIKTSNMCPIPIGKKKENTTTSTINNENNSSTPAGWRRHPSSITPSPVQTRKSNNLNTIGQSSLASSLIYRSLIILYFFDTICCLRLLDRSQQDISNNASTPNVGSGTYFMANSYGFFMFTDFYSSGSEYMPNSMRFYMTNESILWGKTTSRINSLWSVALLSTGNTSLLTGFKTIQYYHISQNGLDAYNKPVITATYTEEFTKAGFSQSVAAEGSGTSYLYLIPDLTNTEILKFDCTLKIFVKTLTIPMGLGARNINWNGNDYFTTYGPASGGHEISLIDKVNLVLSNKVFFSTVSILYDFLQNNLVSKEHYLSAKTPSNRYYVYLIDLEQSYLKNALVSVLSFSPFNPIDRWINLHTIQYLWWIEATSATTTRIGIVSKKVMKMVYVINKSLQSWSIVKSYDFLISTNRFLNIEVGFGAVTTSGRNNQMVIMFLTNQNWTAIDAAGKCTACLTMHYLNTINGTWEISDQIVSKYGANLTSGEVSLWKDPKWIIWQRNNSWWNLWDTAANYYNFLANGGVTWLHIDDIPDTYGIHPNGWTYKCATTNWFKCKMLFFNCTMWSVGYFFFKGDIKNWSSNNIPGYGINQLSIVEWLDPMWAEWYQNSSSCMVWDAGYYLKEDNGGFADLNNQSWYTNNKLGYGPSDPGLGVGTILKKCTMAYCGDWFTDFQAWIAWLTQTVLAPGTTPIPVFEKVDNPGDPYIWSPNNILGFGLDSTNTLVPWYDTKWLSCFNNINEWAACTTGYKILVNDPTSIKNSLLNPWTDFALIGDYYGIDPLNQNYVKSCSTLNCQACRDNNNVWETCSLGFIRRTEYNNDGSINEVITDTACVVSVPPSYGYDPTSANTIRKWISPGCQTCLENAFIWTAWKSLYTYFPNTEDQTLSKWIPPVDYDELYLKSAKYDPTNIELTVAFNLPLTNRKLIENSGDSSLSSMIESSVLNLKDNLQISLIDKTYYNFTKFKVQNISINNAGNLIVDLSFEESFYSGWMIIKQNTSEIVLFNESILKESGKLKNTVYPLENNIDLAMPTIIKGNIQSTVTKMATPLVLVSKLFMYIGLASATMATAPGNMAIIEVGNYFTYLLFLNGNFLPLPEIILKIGSGVNIPFELVPSDKPENSDWQTMNWKPSENFSIRSISWNIMTNIGPFVGLIGAFAVFSTSVWFLKSYFDRQHAISEKKALMNSLVSSTPHLQEGNVESRKKTKNMRRYSNKKKLPRLKLKKKGSGWVDDVNMNMTNKLLKKTSGVQAFIRKPIISGTIKSGCTVNYIEPSELNDGQPENADASQVKKKTIRQIDQIPPTLKKKKLHQIVSILESWIGPKYFLRLVRSNDICLMQYTLLHLYNFSFDNKHMYFGCVSSIIIILFYLAISYFTFIYLGLYVRVKRNDPILNKTLTPDESIKESQNTDRSMKINLNHYNTNSNATDGFEYKTATQGNVNKGYNTLDLINFNQDDLERLIDRMESKKALAKDKLMNSPRSSKKPQITFVYSSSKIDVQNNPENDKSIIGATDKIVKKDSLRKPTVIKGPIKEIREIKEQKNANVNLEIIQNESIIVNIRRILRLRKMSFLIDTYKPNLVLWYYYLPIFYLIKKAFYITAVVVFLGGRGVSQLILLTLWLFFSTIITIVTCRKSKITFYLFEVFNEFCFFGYMLTKVFVELLIANDQDAGICYNLLTTKPSSSTSSTGFNRNSVITSDKQIKWEYDQLIYEKLSVIMAAFLLIVLGVNILFVLGTVIELIIRTVRKKIQKKRALQKTKPKTKIMNTPRSKERVIPTHVPNSGSEIERMCPQPNSILKIKSSGEDEARETPLNDSRNDFSSDVNVLKKKTTFNLGRVESKELSLATDGSILMKKSARFSAMVNKNARQSVISKAKLKKGSLQNIKTGIAMKNMKMLVHQEINSKPQSKKLANSQFMISNCGDDVHMFDDIQPVAVKETLHDKESDDNPNNTSIDNLAKDRTPTFKWSTFGDMIPSKDSMILNTEAISQEKSRSIIKDKNTPVSGLEKKKKKRKASDKYSVGLTLPKEDQSLYQQDFEYFYNDNDSPKKQNNRTDRSKMQSSEDREYVQATIQPLGVNPVKKAIYKKRQNIENIEKYKLIQQKLANKESQLDGKQQIKTKTSNSIPYGAQTTSNANNKRKRESWFAEMEHGFINSNGLGSEDTPVQTGPSTTRNSNSLYSKFNKNKIKKYKQRKNGLLSNNDVQPGDDCADAGDNNAFNINNNTTNKGKKSLKACTEKINEKDISPDKQLNRVSVFADDNE